MKLTQHELDTNQSCSCTSCLYGTDSDRASLKRVKAGSRIDKLYFGKYLPLREKKLLDKLVKTRAVYDDVRKQLLSESSSSIGNKANLKPRKQLPLSKTDKEHDYTENSSDIFELVDMVDRGVLLGQNKINECCSCCSCGSKMRLQEQGSKGLRHRHAGGRISSKSSAISRQRMAHDIRLGKHVRYAKHIRSDPCTCTLQFSDLSNHQLTTTVKGKHHKKPQPVLESLPIEEGYPASNKKITHQSIIQSGMAEANKKSLTKCACRVKDNIESGARKSLEKITATTQKLKQRIEANATKSIQKENQEQRIELSSLLIKQPALGEISRRSLVKCACKVKENIELGAIKSLEKIRGTKQKMKEKVEAGIRKSSQKENQKQKNESGNILNEKTTVEEARENSLVKCACKVKDSVGKKEKEKQLFELETLRVRKDSLTVYKQQLERKRQLKDWECDFDCFPEECVPEECYRIKKRRRAPKLTATGFRTKTRRQVKETETSSASDFKVQALHFKESISTATKKQKLKTRENGNNLPEQLYIKEVGSKKQESRKGPKQRKRKKLRQKICTCEEIIPTNTGHKTKSVKSMTNLPPRTSPLDMPATTNMAKASISSIKPVKMAKSSRNSTGSSKLIKVSRSTVGIVRPQSNSESDFVQNSRQAVRIGSSVSFNIEFYKDKPLTKIPTVKQRVTLKHKTSNKIHKSQHRRSASDTSQKQAITNTHAGEYALKRCFCTLKLKAKRTKSKINKSFAKERKVSNLTKRKSVQGNIKTTKESSLSKKVSRLSPMSDLLPYECAPMVCIPGTCNPKECEQLIKKRGVKYNSIKTSTNYKTKSTPSATSKSVSELKYKNTQATKNKKINIPEKQELSPLTPLLIPLNDSRIPQKQVVRIGSTFSFNIEFSRERPTNNQSKIDTQSVKLKGNRSEKDKEEKIIKIEKSIQHKLSPVSTPTIKSRYSSTKHKLRRCFCTLGLGKPDKRKEKTESLSRGTLTVSQSITQNHHFYSTRAMETEKKENSRKHLNHNLLPYECALDECIRNECIAMTKRQPKPLKGHTKQSNTEYRKTKSTYSFTPKSKQPIKVKKDKSASPTYKTKVQKNVTVPGEARLIASSPNRQAVRIGSNFSFNVEFYKDTSPPLYNSHVQPEYETSKNVLSKNKSHHEPKNVKNVKCGCTKIQKKERNVSIGPAIKRCFCTLKLQKSGKKKIKRNVISTGTETIFSKEEMSPKIIKATKGTKANMMFNNMDLLEPFECEPYICIPGKCDPLKCQLQEFGVSTDHVKKKSTASVTDKLAGKAKNFQSYTEHQKSHSKKRRPMKYSIPNKNSEKPLRQAVIISSNFSFNVEFFKNRKYGEMIPKEILYTKPKIVKVKGVKSSVSQRNSQSVEIKKNHKASGVEHVLKRCFCTLMLQNKAKQQDQQKKTYMRALKTTVMPIQVCTKRMNTADSKTYTHIPVPFKKTNINNNNMIYYCYYNRDEENTHKMEKAMNMKPRNYSKIRSPVKYTESCFTKINENQSQLIGLSPFLKSCFCTMNTQVEKSDKKSHKLKPYECEPGICVPEECDPYACQKLIMKRLLKSVSTTTGTKIRSKSISSGTVPLSPESKTKKNQYAKTIQRNEREQRSTLKYEPPMPYRQAVRVGSNFSFNIELYKDRSPSASTSEGYKQPRFSSSTKSVKPVDKKLKNRGTEGLETIPYDKSSQSKVKTQARASSVAPILKKCFCTLKLQKKGRQHNAINLQVHERKVSLPNKSNEFPKVRTTETGQNTSTQKPQTHLFDLSPYECEPLVCVPGECDPDKCLELIQKRNKKRQTREFGTDSIRRRKRSASSLTTQKSRRSKKKQIQAGKIETKPGYSNERINKVVTKPSRQAVRIGSSCSFNIEFYKYRSPSGDNFDASSSPQHYIKKKREIIGGTEKNSLKEKNKFTETASQDSTMVRHRDSQVKSLATRVKSTNTTSFIKRCFCTAKLHGADKQVKTDNKVNQNPKDSSSFFKKCLCKLKSIKTTETPHKTANTETKTLITTDKFIKQQMTQNTYGHAHRPHNLEPYECERGVCIPGECDPYVCEKKIQRRKAKLHTKMSITDTPEKRSVSTRYKYSKASKGILTHSKDEKINKENLEGSVKERRKHHSSSPERNVVRIGSNFSFDIEFYKNKTNFNQIQRDAKAVKEITKEGKSHDIKSSPKTENKGLTSKYTSLRDRKSQVKVAKKEDRASGIGPILKRCFCTLKLHNQSNAVTDNSKKDWKKKDHANISRFSTKGTETSGFKELPNVYTKHAMTYNLKPYECEPYICIPGECNPYECEKLIRKRLRESATSTQKHKVKSTTSMIKSAYKSKDKTQQLSVKHKNKLYTKNDNNERVTSLSEKTKKPISLSVNRPPRQAVRIGSTFSFDIEFSKNKETGDSVKHKSLLQQDEIIKDRYPNQPSRNCRNAKCQSSKSVRHMDSQVLNKKVRSKMSQVAPFLKRCFCTLKLHKPDVKPIMKQSVATTTNEKFKDQFRRNVDIPNGDKKNVVPVSLRNLDPNECEPGVCVPGKCNPYKCEEQIKKRRKKMESKLSSTVGFKDQSTSSYAPSLKSFKDKNSQENRYLLEQNNGKNDRKYVVKKHQNLKSSKDSHRQAVRVGSSFSFDIEFYKEKTPKGLYLRDKINAPDIGEKKIKREIKLKNATTDHRISFRHRESQLKAKTDSKGFGIEPLLKRCFCTLKFQKVGKLQHPTTMILEPKVKESSVTANIKDKKRNEFMKHAGSENKLHGLKSYECEPYVCVPGECDPFECEKRIKRRNLKELGTGTRSPTMKSVSSLIPDGNKFQTKKNQALRDMHKQINSLNREPKKVKRFSHNHSNKMAKPANRQAVRIGSNFSFNVEFYKERSRYYNQIINENNKVLKGKSKANVSEIKSKSRKSIKSKSRASRCKCPKRNQKLQVADQQKESKGSDMAPVLKRCFCTLALQRKDDQSISNLTSSEVKPSNISTRNKTTLTKAEPFLCKLDPYECEPGICIPGECNPYECQELIKKRDIKHKSKKSSTRRHPQISVASVAAKSTPTSKSKRLQYNAIDTRTSKDSAIVEQPRFPFIFDRMNNAKQAVKIGSNLSFNIEFYKDNSPIAGFEVSEYSHGKHSRYSKGERVTNSKPTSHSIKMTNTNICKLKNCKMQAQGLETIHRASTVDHALKRCFCTLKLHKTNLQNSKTLRPNVITVGRVDKIKTKSPFMPSQSRNRMKSSINNKETSRCPIICTASTKDTKTVATKINKKYLKSESLYASQNIENQETQKNTKIKKKNDSTDLKTILPYTPRKFNKNTSKTLLLQTKKEKSVSFGKKCCSYCKNNVNKEDYANKDKHGHKVSQSKSNNNGKVKFSKGRGKTIEIKETNEKPNLRPSKRKGFLWRCIQLFSKQNNNFQSVTNECPFEPPNCQTQSQKKMHKDILKISKSERHPKTAQTTVPKKSKSLKMTTLSENNKSQENKYKVQETKKYSRFQGGDAGQNEMSPAVNIVRNPKDVLEDKKFICLNCQARKSKKQNKLVKFALTPAAKGNFESTASSKQGNSSRTPGKTIVGGKCNLPSSLETCFCTKGKEAKKDVAGTPITNENETLKECTVCCGTKKEYLHIERKKHTELEGHNKLTGLNYKHVKKINPSAETKKPCCPCTKSVKSKIQKTSKENRPFVRSSKKTFLCGKAVKKCQCGSRICGKEPKKQYVEYTKIPRNPCVCGSVTCARIAKKKHTCMCCCECGRVTDIAKLNKQKKKHKEYLKRQNKYNKEDRARKIQRLKANAKMFKNAMKYRDTSDVVLAVQSVFDITKLGCTTLGDVARSTHRTVTDPKYTVECLKTTVKDPKRAWKGMKASVSDSGVGETYKRVKLRVGAMSCMKKARSKLEECAFTNYLLHMIDTNPKKKSKRKPRKRKREEIDVGCSLFMSTLRKRPLIFVYKLCPWFYPHCLSILNVWKQFSDIMLFLLAVVVWSPCILCMEACRAMMCCFLCTG